MKTGSLYKKIIAMCAILANLTVFGSLTAPTLARADFRICNDTKSLVGAALGYRNDGTWISEGWFQIPAETCNALIEGDLSSRFYYIYAEDADKGGQWQGEVFMCTNDREFKIKGVEDCFKRGHVKTGFFEIDTGNRNSWMVRLTEQSQSAPVQ
ncbi:MAG: DUF1036 domain-containing protein [Rhizobiaceae bacterium]